MSGRTVPKAADRVCGPGHLVRVVSSTGGGLDSLSSNTRQFNIMREGTRLLGYTMFK